MCIRDSDKIDNVIPNISACSLLTFPVGIGLKQVLVINLSRSASYHIFRAPAAPAPIVTKNILIIDFSKAIDVGAVNKPTVHVKITRDITLGFINNAKDFKYLNILNETDLFFKILLVTSNQH